MKEYNVLVMRKSIYLEKCYVTVEAKNKAEAKRLAKVAAIEDEVDDVMDADFETAVEVVEVCEPEEVSE